MNDDREKQAQAEAGVGSEDEEDEDCGSETSAGESLLSLVQPEMVTLSKHWLDALKDHALLSLPPGKSCPSICVISMCITSSHIFS